MAEATAAFEKAKAQVVTLRSKYEAALTVWNEGKSKLELLLVQIDKQKEKINRASATAEKAQARWKKLAQERASREAVSILDASEMRARKTWEAKRIQKMALAQAQAAKVKAAKEA